MDDSAHVWEISIVFCSEFDCIVYFAFLVYKQVLSVHMLDILELFF